MRWRAKRTSHIRQATIAGQADLRSCPPSHAQQMRCAGNMKTLANRPRQDVRVINAAPKATCPMHWHRHDDIRCQPRQPFTALINQHMGQRHPERRVFGILKPQNRGTQQTVVWGQPHRSLKSWLLRIAMCARALANDRPTRRRRPESVHKSGKPRGVRRAVRDRHRKTGGRRRRTQAHTKRIAEDRSGRDLDPAKSRAF